MAPEPYIDFLRCYCNPAERGEERYIAASVRLENNIRFAYVVLRYWKSGKT
jgi:hypothetical protein